MADKSLTRAQLIALITDLSNTLADICTSYGSGDIDPIMKALLVVTAAEAALRAEEAALEEWYREHEGEAV